MTHDCDMHEHVSVGQFVRSSQDTARIRALVEDIDKTIVLFTLLGSMSLTVGYAKGVGFSEVKVEQYIVINTTQPCTTKQETGTASFGRWCSCGIW